MREQREEFESAPGLLASVARKRIDAESFFDHFFIFLTAYHMNTVKD